MTTLALWWGRGEKRDCGTTVAKTPLIDPGESSHRQMSRGE